MLSGIAKVLPLSVACPSAHNGTRIPKRSSLCRVLGASSVAGETAADEGERASRLANEKRRRRRSEEEARRAKPTSASFVKPLSDLYPRLPCRICKGLGEIVCDVCDGQGKFNKGGYHKKNPISVERIVGSKWTAMERTFGWRHFRVWSKRKGSGKEWFVEMTATCDESTRFWVNFQNLKERERWSMGWLQKAEILDAQNKETGSNLVCQACKGKGQQPCTCTFRDPDKPMLDIIEV